MRQSSRILVALPIVVAMGLVALGFWSIRRQNALFERDMLRDNQTLGRLLAGVVSDIWQQEGPERSLRLIEALDVEVSQVRIRWIPFDGRDGDEPLSQPLTRLDDPSVSPRFLRSYVPIRTSEGHVGALEVARSLTERDASVSATLRNVLFLLLVILVLCVMVAWPSGGARASGSEDRGPAPGEEERDQATDEDLEEPSQTDRLGLLADEVSSLGLRLAETRSALISEESERRVVEDQLRHVERLSTVGKLAAGIAHELGTPLNVIIGRAGMLAQGDLEDEVVSRSVEIIHQQALRITETVEQLLDFARVNETSKRHIDLGQIMDTTASLLADARGSTHAELIVEESVGGAVTLGDPRQLQQVLTNLIVNAFQALDEAGTVTLSLTREPRTCPSRPEEPSEERLCLRVRDDGVGIDPEVLPHIFEPFVTTKPVGQGTGLGLSVACGIVEDHGGWIEVDSRVGEGSCFTVCLHPSPPDRSPDEGHDRVLPEGPPA